MQDYNLWQEHWKKILVLIGYSRLNLYFYTGEKLFELFCIDFGKYLLNIAIYLLYCFASNIMVVPRNDTFLYNTGQIKFPCVT